MDVGFQGWSTDIVPVEGRASTQVPKAFGGDGGGGGAFGDGGGGGGGFNSGTPLEVVMDVQDEVCPTANPKRYVVLQALTVSSSLRFDVRSQLDLAHYIERDRCNFRLR